MQYGVLVKLAGLYRFKAFISLGSEFDVQKAFKKLTGLIQPEDLQRLFDLWLESKDDKSKAQELESFIDDILVQNSDSESFSTISEAIDAIAEDVEEAENEESGDIFEQDVESAKQSINYDPEQAAYNEIGGRVTEDISQKRTRDAEYKKRSRELLRSLKSRPDYGSLKQAVIEGATDTDLGITREQFSAIKYDINKNLGYAPQKKYQEIKRLMQLGLSREQAEEKYKDLSFTGFSPEKIQQTFLELSKKEPNLTIEDVKDRLQKITDDQIGAYKKQNIVALTGAQRKRIHDNTSAYALRLINNQSLQPEQAKQKAKEVFDVLKKKIKYLSIEDKDKEIASFISELKKAS